MTQAFQTKIDASTKLKVNGNYVNLILTNYPKRGEVGLQPGEYIQVKKDSKYAEPFTSEKTYTANNKTWTANLHRCTVIVDNKQTSFMTFKDEEANEFIESGGVDDLIHIGCEEYNYTNKKGQKIIATRLRFRKAQ